jgi:hypothetical protein
MSTPTSQFRTIEVLNLIHRGQALLKSKMVPDNDKAILSPAIDGVLSFTAFFLRQESPEYRPSQVDQIIDLREAITLLENAYAY